jgi:hypothetical protein
MLLEKKLLNSQKSEDKEEDEYDILNLDFDKIDFKDLK